MEITEIAIWWNKMYKYQKAVFVYKDKVANIFTIYKVQ